MESVIVRRLPFARASGARNMAMDEALMHSAQEGCATFRLYQWIEPTVSLGYFQSHYVVGDDVLLKQIPYVRRPSGGMTLVHHHEVTYALALPGKLAGRRSSAWLAQVHEVIAQALNELGIATEAARELRHKSASHLCFQHITKGDLLIDGNKIAGSSQRRRKNALLQHGAILMRASPYAPSLRGICDLRGSSFSTPVLLEVLESTLADALNWRMIASDWSARESVIIEELAVRKYGRQEWKTKR